ncbi:site-specific recombinase XerD-like domain protein [Synechococcus sp. A15-127]|uniref:tyrosine-type recombinase/integrase n=1 Tax=Synechococcus sp. A15-127 TaxID=1050624 RepID=UPI001861B159|nr:integrase [Synechococcus sp. A15-127]QNI93936.1 site-specific recombinase XerD-like domain protein [Synechococcus sp. A15-127]
MPKDCRIKVGKNKWTEPGGNTLNEARAKVPSFLARTDAEIAEARGELQITNQERVLRQGNDPELNALDLAELANPRVGMYLDDGSANPEFESMLAMAEALKAGKARTLLSTEGLLQARRLGREPAPRTFEGWVKALNAFMAYTGKSKPFECSRADAVAYKDTLLTRMSRSSAKTQLAYLAGLWSTLVEKQGTGEHIFKGLPGTLDETTKAKALRAAQAKRNRSFEPSSPWNTWTGSTYVPVFQLLYFTGCRLAEVAALRAEDIYDDYISVEWQEERSLKTANSVRDIPLHPSLVPVVSSLREGRGHVWPQLMTITKTAGVEVIRWGHNVAKPCKKVTGVRPKDFRDRFVTALRDQDFNDTNIRRLSGHSSIDVHSSHGGKNWDKYVQMINSLN